MEQQMYGQTNKYPKKKKPIYIMWNLIKLNSDYVPVQTVDLNQHHQTRYSRTFVAAVSSYNPKETQHDARQQLKCNLVDQNCNQCTHSPILHHLNGSHVTETNEIEDQKVRHYEEQAKSHDEPTSELFGDSFVFL